MHHNIYLPLAWTAPWTVSAAGSEEGLYVLGYNNRREWVRAFTGAVQSQLDRRSAESVPSNLQLTASRCRRHGKACVAVVYGELLDHFSWAETDPNELAERLINILLAKS